jgi:AcrR family transcriptional regulator
VIKLTRDESKARTRSELLRAANRLFLRDGFVATSLAAIAEEAGLTKGAVYSNFESKEDLFIAVLQQAAADDQWYAAPIDGGAISRRPSRRHVALFLELNAAALRSERTRKWVAAHNREFFESLGRQLADALGAEESDRAVLGLVAQSLHAGLLMHGAFDADVDDTTFKRAYELLGAFAAS